MISPHLRMLDINPFQWRHLFDMLFPSPGRQLVVIHDGTQIVKAFDTQQGLCPDLRGQHFDDARTLAARLYAERRPARVFVLDRQALDDYFATVHRVWSPALDGDHYLQLARLAMDDDPRLVRYPPEPRGLHLAGIPYAWWQHTLDCVPNGATLILGVFEDNRIWASIILQVNSGQIDLVATSDLVLPLETYVEDWQSTSAELRARVAAQIGPPFAGLFCTRRAFLDLFRSDNKPARLMALQAAGELQIEPYPTCLPGPMTIRSQ